METEYQQIKEIGKFRRNTIMFWEEHRKAIVAISTTMFIIIAVICTIFVKVDVDVKNGGLNDTYNGTEIVDMMLKNATVAEELDSMEFMTSGDTDGTTKVIYFGIPIIVLLF